MERLKPGMLVQHFKREMIDNPTTEYLYMILDIAEHTETKEKLVVYKALYKNACGTDYGVFARPYSMFLSEVDHEKYPNIKQKYRFEEFVG